MCHLDGRASLCEFRLRICVYLRFRKLAGYVTGLEGLSFREVGSPKLSFENQRFT
jgi:hypothetical protein